MPGTESRHGGAKPQLKRILGLAFGIAVIFGGTVGVGILRLPGEVAGKLGTPWLILLVWALGGLYSLLGAISTSELGAALPQAGGFYVYSKRAFGPAAGFAVGWADWMVNCTSIAYAARAASEYLTVLVPQLAGIGSVLRPRLRWECWRCFAGCTGLDCG